MDLLPTFLALITVGVACGGAGYAAGRLRERPAGVPADHDAQVVVREGLERLHDQLRDLEHGRIAWQHQLHEQVSGVRASAEGLRRETASLGTALRRPQVRGRWGELHLRRAVEVAGLVPHCDFTEQVRLDDGARRPDLVVHLAGNREVVVDAKVPLEAYLDATAEDDVDAREEHLGRHARQVRQHVDALGAKAYWQSLDRTPEFVVLFVPAESMLAAALEADPSLIEHAAARQVVLASPSTLIALLRTVAQGWSHARLTEQAAQVHRIGRELHARLGTLSGHLDQLGRSLNAAVGHYNSTVGSLDARVLTQARRFRDLAVTEADLPAPRRVDLHAVPGDRRAEADPGSPARTVNG